MADATEDVDAQLVPGALLTVAEALRQIENLTPKMRESEPLVKRLAARLHFLRSTLKGPSTMGPSERSKLVARFVAAVSDALQFLTNFSKKKALQRIAASRLAREGVRRLHVIIDIVFQDAGLSYAPEMNEWKEHEAADIEAQRERLEAIVKTSGAIFRGLSIVEMEEALLEIRLEIERRDNPEEFVALLKRAFKDSEATAGVHVWELEGWFLRRDDVEVAETPFERGAFGDVYRAKRGAEAAEVCVKQPSQRFGRKQEEFVKEARIWHKLSHPNVLKLFGGCHVGSPLFFASELASAGNFVDYLYKSGNKGRLWELFRQVAQGLAFFHSQEVVHGNLKCSNLLVGDDGLAKLSGFRFSFNKTLSTSKSRMIQPISARWKAPECLLEQGPAGNPTFASDVFALGMCIIEAKTSEISWGMQTEAEVVDTIRSGHTYQRPDGVFTDREWELVEGLTAFDPKERWSLDRALEAMKEFADEEAEAEALKELGVLANTPDGKQEGCQQSLERRHDGQAVKEFGLLAASETEGLSHDCDATRLTGRFITVVEALEQIEKLTDEMRESEALVKRLAARLQFLRSALKKPSVMKPSERTKLVAHFATTIGKVIWFLKKFSKKKTLQRIAASRLVREGVRRLHTTIDIVFQSAGLGDAPEMNEWKEHEAADVEEQLEHLGYMLEWSGGAVRGLSIAQAEEALLEVRLEIERHNNPEDFVALLKRASADPDTIVGVKLSELEVWFVRRDDIEIAEDAIGVGAYGDVYRAKRGAEAAEVCVKLLYVDGPDMQDTFIKEARIWCKLSHPNVVAMLGGCHVGSPLFLVSELVKAGNFVDYLYKTENKGRLWELFRQAAQGLAFLHSQEVIHADIKCNNLLVGNDGLAKLCDFGFSHIKMMSIGRSLKEQPSSARWKAPECLLEQGLDARPTFASDVFSLGMSIIEAKIGGVPWGMKTEDDIFDAMADGDGYPRPDGVFTDREWELVEGMTAFDLAKRWSLDRALEMLKELADEETAADTDASYFLPDRALTARGRKLIDHILESNQDQRWTQAQVTQALSKLIEKETSAKNTVEKREATEDTSKPLTSTAIRDKLERLNDHIQRTSSLTSNDQERLLQQVQQLGDWYQLEDEMAAQWESNFPDIARCSSCESDNPLDNAYCCECGEAFEGGSWQSRREQLDFRFVVTDASRVEAAIAEFNELYDHETAEAVVRELRRGGKRVCPRCSLHCPAGKRFCEDCGAVLHPAMADIDDSFESPSAIAVRLTLQSEIQRLKHILQQSREQEAACRKANAVPPLELPCSRCGELNSEFEVFCRECGNDIEIIRANPL